MPNGASQARAEQISTLNALVHQMTVSPEFSQLLEKLEAEASNGSLSDWEKASIRESKRSHRRASLLPESFVRDLSKTASLAQVSWRRARQDSDFSIFADPLKRLVDLKRQEAAYYGYSEHIYDALIDLFEPGMTVARLQPVFDRLKVGTERLLKKIDDSGVTVDNGVLFTDFDADRQLEFSKKIIRQIGFDFTNGRVDLSAHPFCTSFGVQDVRLTTRVYPDDLRSCLFGLIHEAGHGMYEQGFDQQLERTPLAEGASMGIHESQSLFWENMIGRSEGFWQWAFDSLKQTFPERLGSYDAHEFFRMINVMKPTFIRVEADELTYNLHIILRFEIERALISGTMEVDQIPEEWNARMEQYLGIVPANDAEGCLQDVHWSFGGFGYFPSYTLGKLYAAMFYQQALKEMPDLEQQVAAGEFTNVLAWLRDRIHRHGRSRTPVELVQDICGTELTEKDFLEHLERKIDRVYASS
jgi:carboxypeptidase Taq